MINDKEMLKKRILECKKKLKELKPMIETSDSSNALYNKIMIEKAKLMDELKKQEEGFIKKVIKKITPKKEKLICDYFKS